MEHDELVERSSVVSEDVECGAQYGALNQRVLPRSVAQTPLGAAVAALVPGLVLVTCVLSASSVGLAAFWKPEVPSLALAAWKTQTWTLAVIPMVVFEAARQRAKGVFWTAALREDRRLRWHVFLASCAQMWWSASMMIALRYTSVSNAFLFNNAHGVILVVSRLVAGSGIHKQELIGVLLGLLGAVIAMWTPGERAPNSTFGDAVALTGSVAGALCVALTREARDVLPSGVFSLLLNVLSAPLFLIIGLVSPSTYTFSRSPSTGLFGWLAPEMLLFALFLGGVCGLLGGSGLIVLFDFLPSLVISLVMLLEPIIGAYLTASLGLTPWPELHSLCGASLVIVGIACIITTSSSSLESTHVPRPNARSP
mmetsp:Transcript_2033/g.5414  ORF Transcript_2033/g.5414 Transcript_2033/m.5414 type:complete len:368 (-) Transcript_2033:50-1153(-)